MVKMVDRKFLIAVGIIVVLALVLAYVTLIAPGIQGYIVKKQIDAQTITIQSIIQVVNQQGYVVLPDGNSSIVLVKYQQSAQQGQQTIPTNSSK